MWSNAMAERGSKTAFAFPGVGVELSGAEADLLAWERETLGPFVAAASSCAKVDFAAALAAGRMADIADREQQYFTYAFGVGLAEVVRRRGIEPCATAGYSFGVYAALAGAGAISFESGFAVLERAFAIMAEEVRDADCGMAIIVGLGLDEVRSIVAKLELSGLVLANSNNDTCHILSGRSAELAAALELAAARDAVAARRLPVAIPYHHPEVLRRGSARLREALGDIAWSAPRCPVVSSIDQRLLTEPETLRDFVAANIATPISWREVVRQLASLGVGTVFECGPGISLSQNARFMDGAPRHVNVKTIRRKLDI